MLDAFLYAGLPYAAIVVCIAGSIYRYRSDQFSYSSLSSQFLERRRLRWGALPFHLGILIVLLGHVVAIAAPSVWAGLTSHFAFLIAVEIVGIIAAFLALAALAVLLVRRLTSPRIQAVSSIMDIVILVLLIVQVLVGIGVASGDRWGAQWSTQTTTPYFWSLFTLTPRTDIAMALTPTVKLHLTLAWIIIMLLPFSRLVHVFSFPLAYLWRPPQRVVWTTAHRFRPEEAAAIAPPTVAAGRRHFVRAAAGLGTAGVLLSVGVMGKLAQFFRGPRMSPEEESHLLKDKLDRLELTAEQRRLEIERMNSAYIRIGRLGDLSPRDGKYFIDYRMRPALAFRDAAGMPLLISAKCTHLGCTVASTVDDAGRLLCPCHMSYFDIQTGAPNAGSPAAGPLPRLGWALMDAQGAVVCSQGPDGQRTGEPNPAQLEDYGVFISKQFEEMT